MFTLLTVEAYELFLGIQVPTHGQNPSTAASAKAFLLGMRLGAEEG